MPLRTTLPRDLLRSAAVFVAALLLTGCAVGIVTVRAPERPGSRGVPPLEGTVTFDLCLPELDGLLAASDFESARRNAADRFRAALSLGGLEATPVPRAGMPAHFTVTRRRTDDHGWSGLLSLFTFSVLPGYFAERHRLDVDVREVPGAARPEQLTYERQVSTWLWLPLIFHPDVVAGINGGWESPKAKDGGERALVERLAADLRERLAGRESLEGGGGVTCPAPSFSESRPTVIVEPRQEPAGHAQ